MTRTASRTSRRGAIGRCTRGVAPPFAQVTVTGMVANVEAAADRGTSIVHVETTVAVTTSGADADCACASAGAAARIAAAKTVRTIASILQSSRLGRPGPWVAFYIGVNVTVWEWPLSVVDVTVTGCRLDSVCISGCDIEMVWGWVAVPRISIPTIAVPATT